MNQTVPFTMMTADQRRRRRVYDPLSSSSHHSIEIDGVEHDVSNLFFDLNEINSIPEYEVKSTLTLYPSASSIPDEVDDVDIIKERCPDVTDQQTQEQSAGEGVSQSLPQHRGVVQPRSGDDNNDDAEGDGFRQLEQQAFPHRSPSVEGNVSGRRNIVTQQHQQIRIVQPIPESTTIQQGVVDLDTDVRSTASRSTDSTNGDDDNDNDDATPSETNLAFSRSGVDRRATQRMRRRRARRGGAAALNSSGTDLSLVPDLSRQSTTSGPDCMVICDGFGQSCSSVSVATTSTRSMSTTASSDDSYSPTSSRSPLSNSSDRIIPSRSSITGEAVKMMEISPGQFLPVRGASETEHAIRSAEIQETPCTSCSTKLFCLIGAELVLCPTCRVVGPILDVGGGPNRGRSGKRVYGVGLGLTHSDIDEMKACLGVN